MSWFQTAVAGSAALWALASVGCAPQHANATSTDRDTNPSTAECDASLVPELTGPNSRTGAVKRSGVHDASYEAWQAFDASRTSMWISGVFETPAWISFEWTSGSRTVTSYAIDFSNGSLTSRAPRDWVLAGWNGAWNAIDTRSAQTDWQTATHRVYTVASPGSYSAYRLEVSDDNDDRQGVVAISIGRLTLMGCTR